MLNSKRTGVLLIIGSCTSLQFGAAFAVQLFPLIGSGTTSMLRLLLAGLLIMAASRPTFRYNAEQWRALVLFGTTFAGMNGFFYLALAHIPLGIAVTIEFTGPLLLAAILSRSRRDLIWVLLAAIGLVILAWEASGDKLDLNATGVLCALTAGFFWACYILCSRKVGQLVPGQSGLGISVLIGGIILIPFGINNVSDIWDPKILLFATAVALLSSVIPYSLELAALRTLNPGMVGVLLSLEPVIAAIAGLMLLRQPLTVGSIIAILFIMIASIGTTRTTA
ncbi:MAG: EamA family transporter [Corynebacterium sp.]|nr:EamA family transporter [Corynebacterium sp.]